MPKRRKKLNSTTRYLIMLGAILFAANILLGVVLLQQSISTVQAMVRKSMMNVTTTAASLIDGDILRDLTREDIGSPPYGRIYSSLSAFQKNTDVKYIYAVRQTGEDSFVFTVDPDPVDPGEFGEEVLVTDALREAAQGVAAVDDAPAEDEWGNFYSAYCPVFDSEGRVAGIIGVDFDAKWFSDQLMEHSWSIILVSVISIAVASLIVLFVTSRVRKQYRRLNATLAVLNSDIEALESEISSDDYLASETRKKADAPDEEPSEEGIGESDSEIEELRRKMNGMHNEIRKYLAFVEKKSRTDAMTRVGNSTAYAETFRALNKRIEENDPSVSFRIAVFDINFLKPVNDEFGHTFGDNIIKAAARIIAEVFGYENAFRIGGDEFLVILENVSADEIVSGFEKLDRAIEDYNASEAERKGVLSISKGQAEYRPGEDKAFRDVFHRADQEMYADKEEYHRKHSAPLR